MDPAWTCPVRPVSIVCSGRRRRLYRYLHHDELLVDGPRQSFHPVASGANSPLAQDHDRREET